GGARAGIRRPERVGSDRDRAAGHVRPVDAAGRDRGAAAGRYRRAGLVVGGDPGGHATVGVAVAGRVPRAGGGRGVGGAGAAGGGGGGGGAEGVFRALAEQLGHRGAGWRAASLCELAALRLPAQAAPRATDLVQRLRDIRPNDPGVAFVERFATTLRYRQDMLEELS